MYDSENELGETVYKSYLNVSVAPAAALEFQHFKDTIIDKINSYFGYRAIMDLRIQQNYLPKVNAFNKKFSNRNSLTSEEEKMINNNVEDMKNNDLKDSLISLGVNITKDNKCIPPLRLVLRTRRMKVQMQRKSVLEGRENFFFENEKKK